MRGSRASSACASSRPSSRRPDARATSPPACSTYSDVATAGEVRVVSAEEEGRLAFEGAVARADTGESVVAVCDVGGGSTELVVGTQLLGPAWVRSVDLGSLRLTAALLPGDPPTAAEIESARAVVQSGLAELDPPRPGAGARHRRQRPRRRQGRRPRIRRRRPRASGRAPRVAACGREREGARAPCRPCPHAARGSDDPRPGLPPDRCSVRAVAWRDQGRRCAAARLPASPPARRAESTQLDVARVGKQRPRLVRRQPAQLVDLLGRRELARERRHPPPANALRPALRIHDARRRQLLAELQRAGRSPRRSRAARSPRRSRPMRLPLRERPVVVLRAVHRDDAAIALDHTATSTDHAVFASRFHAALHSSRLRRARSCSRSTSRPAARPRRASARRVAAALRVATTASWCSPSTSWSRFAAWTYGLSPSSSAA